MIFKKRGVESTIEEVALRNLGVTSVEEINDWFRKSYAGDYRIDGIDRAIDILETGKWDRIQIVGDYDIDGTTATAIMRLGLEACGHKVYDRIPHRFSEGFGLNPTIVSEIPDGKTLLITVDNGVAALEAVKLAKSRGFTVIVTDHHLPVTDEDGNPVLPEADCIINPNAVEGQADFNGYCGAGIAFRLVRRLIERRNRLETDESKAKNLTALKAILEPLAMMGTIGDVMELREENYVIARNGLKKLEKRCATAGMLALHDKLWVSHPVAQDIGYKSGPCINANGRLLDDGAAKSVDLLASTDYTAALLLAQEAVDNNNRRKQQVDAGMKLAEMQIKTNGMENDLPLVLYLPGTNEGIVGIIAGRLREKYGTVAIVLTDAEEKGMLKGSGRSIDAVNLKALLDEAAEYLEKYGGHEGAAGLSLKKENFKAFRELLISKAEGFEKEVKTEMYYDLEIEADKVPEALEETLRFGPFGQGNEPIVFKISNFKLIPGNDGKLKNYVGTSGVKLASESCQAIGFGLAERMRETKATTFTLYGTLSYNYFKGDAIPQIEFSEFEEEVSEKEETPLMKALRAKAAGI